MPQIASSARAPLAALAVPQTDLYACVTPEQQRLFVEQMQQLPPDLLAFLTPYTLDEYAEKHAALFLSARGRGGFAVTPQGELLSLFNCGGGDGFALLLHAVRMGARSLECFDGYLPIFYGQFGFREVGRIPWDPSIAPCHWNYARFGKPDLVFMRRGEDA